MMHLFRILTFSLFLSVQAGELTEQESREPVSGSDISIRLRFSRLQGNYAIFYDYFNRDYILQYRRDRFDHPANRSVKRLKPGVIYLVEAGRLKPTPGFFPYEKTYETIIPAAELSRGKCWYGLLNSFSEDFTQLRF